MAALVPVPRQEIIRGLLPGLRTVTGVGGAYLFGSALRAEFRPDSDIDLGIVASHGADVFQVIGDVESVCRPVGLHLVHAMVLNAASTIFAFHVVSTGLLIYCVDDEAVTDLIEGVAIHHEEVGPPYYRALRMIYGGRTEACDGRRAAATKA